jgi:hypothetical protein
MNRRIECLLMGWSGRAPAPPVTNLARGSKDKRSTPCWGYHAVARACLLLGRLDQARRLADHSLESSQRQPGFAAHAQCRPAASRATRRAPELSRNERWRVRHRSDARRSSHPDQSGLVGFIAALAIWSAPASISPLQKICTAGWAWASGSRR